MLGVTSEPDGLFVAQDEAGGREAALFERSLPLQGRQLRREAFDLMTSRSAQDLPSFLQVHASLLASLMPQRATGRLNVVQTESQKLPRRRSAGPDRPLVPVTACWRTDQGLD
ncbi:MAG: hypothetical protein CMJ17_03460 [Phenylobacterium sp.]|nr:hypothetical protein [Phenylobacterium sp.]|tara:strand:+ start:9553 stop:9891 length:339 start_codon:yes stop_codon:yes gene_type:complete